MLVNAAIPMNNTATSDIAKMAGRLRSVPVPKIDPTAKRAGVATILDRKAAKSIGFQMKEMLFRGLPGSQKSVS